MTGLVALLLLQISLMSWDAHAEQKTSTSFSVEAKLMSYLLQNYSSAIPPKPLSGKDSIIVKLGMSLIQIISVKEKDEEIVVTLYMTYSWQDSRLIWDPSDYDGIKIIRIPPAQIWTPDVILENSKDGMMRESVNVNVLVYSDGSAEWLPPAIYKTSCSMEISLFPFDWQNCSLIFRSSAFDQSRLVFGMVYGYSITVDPQAFVPHGEWDLMQRPGYIHRRRRDDSFQKVFFHLIIKRRPQFYVLNMILPCVMITVLSCFTFYLPILSGERISLSISLLLGDTVFALLIVQRTPSTSLAIPLAASYLLFSMSLLFLCVFFCVIGYSFHYRSRYSHKMPTRLRHFVFHRLAPVLKIKQPDQKWKISSNKSIPPPREPQTSNSIVANQLDTEDNIQYPSSKIPFQQQEIVYGFKQRHLKGGKWDMLKTENELPSLLSSGYYNSSARTLRYVSEKIKWKKKLEMVWVLFLLKLVTV
ncbi:unnamed protein product [Clavelina lepadiformis]|uniref:Uncharacterized protein n=2 Tax=Clavelina lepadiformis TaxID=159417 RepID=A0ABP0H397_CLALP